LNGKKPTVVVAGATMPDDKVSVRYDRLHIQIPDEVKKQIGFGNDACSPRRTFPIQMKAFYGRKEGIWPFRSIVEKEFPFNANALAGAELFSMVVRIAEAQRQSKVDQVTRFSNESSQKSVGCEESNNGLVRLALPDGAKEVQCNSVWVDTKNLKKSSDNCAVGGSIVTGTGSITGRDRDCYLVGELFGRKNTCNCKGGGRGKLRISGEYKSTIELNATIKNMAVDEFDFEDDVDITLPADPSLKLIRLSAIVKRRGCEKEHDSIELQVPAVDTQTVQQSSKKGLFSGEYRGHQLRIQTKN
jgi:hypothetical protein